MTVHNHVIKFLEYLFNNKITFLVTADCSGAIKRDQNDFFRTWTGNTDSK